MVTVIKFTMVHFEQWGRFNEEKHFGWCMISSFENAIILLYLC